MVMWCSLLQFLLLLLFENKLELVVVVVGLVALIVRR